MKFIKLTQGKIALVDNEDYDLLMQYKWTYNSGYAIRNKYLGGGRSNPIRKTILMHRLILNIPNGMETDHINGNKLDNRKENLRVVTHGQNMKNKFLYKNNTAGHKGIYWYEKIKRWQVYIMVDKKAIYLGVYKDKDRACNAYQRAAKKYFKEFYRGNNL